jgi:hypothetical protein
MNHHLPKKFDPIPKRHHWYTFFIFLCGMLLPPIGKSCHLSMLYLSKRLKLTLVAVAARFGIGHDFFVNWYVGSVYVRYVADIWTVS